MTNFHILTWKTEIRDFSQVLEVNLIPILSKYVPYKITFEFNTYKRVISVVEFKHLELRLRVLD